MGERGTNGGTGSERVARPPPRTDTCLPADNWQLLPVCQVERWIGANQAASYLTRLGSLTGGRPTSASRVVVYLQSEAAAAAAGDTLITLRTKSEVFIG